MAKVRVELDANDLNVWLQLGQAGWTALCERMNLQLQAAQQPSQPPPPPDNSLKGQAAQQPSQIQQQQNAPRANGEDGARPNQPVQP